VFPLRLHPTPQARLTRLREQHFMESLGCPVVIRQLVKPRPIQKPVVARVLPIDEVDPCPRGCPGRCCKSEMSVAPPEPIGSGCRIHEEEQRHEKGYASIGCPGSPESSRDGG
jgi:hypothetical protein